jgi:hypothetical protein
MLKSDRTTLPVDFAHITAYSSDLADVIEEHYQRFVSVPEPQLTLAASSKRCGRQSQILSETSIKSPQKK